jgi:peptidoglycan hydrolase-like protein with peptidoglycan-binding domain
MKPTNKQLLEWFEYLYQSKAVYLWGANSEKITKKLTDKLYDVFKSKTYDYEYYANKFKEGENRIGADCSGSFYPISGFDTTAEGYYNHCAVKGGIYKIPKDKVCQVFKKNLSGKITHIGLYCGNGYTIEMKSSKDNCVKEKFNPLRWTHYGIPDWIDYVKANPYPIPDRTIYYDTVYKKVVCKGEDVKWVQFELIEDGITEVLLDGKKKKLTIDGSCGKITDAAIKIYQYKHRLSIDGRVGPKTISEMNK